MRIFKFIALLFLINYFLVSGQDFKDAGSYMSFIGELHRQIAKDVLNYTGAYAHGKSAKRVEHSRQAMIKQIKNAQKKVIEMPSFQSDHSLKDSTLAYLNTSLIVLNEEYGKIINMEEISQQSYDAMEAYMLAQDIADEHLSRANERLRNTTNQFAQTYNVKLVSNEDDEISKKIRITNQVNKYHRMVYLVFFKSNKQEVYLVDAISKKDIKAIENHKNFQLQFASEGILKLDTMKPYLEDSSLVLAAKQALLFYQMESREKMPEIIEFLVKEEDILIRQKLVQDKKESEKTKDEISFYNKSIKDFNVLINKFNITTSFLNNERTKITNHWNKTAAAFLDKYTP